MKSAYSVFILFTFLLIPDLIFSQNEIFNFRLPGLENNFVSLSDYENKKALVIVFLLSDCPASQDYSLTLNNLSKKYRQNNVSFIGVFPGKFSTDKELQKFKIQYKIDFLLLKDPEMNFAKKFDVKIVPSCLVVNNESKIIYKGRINDWLFAVGKKRMNITQNNLDDALKCIVNNSPLLIKETIPVGCILEY